MVFFDDRTACGQALRRSGSQVYSVSPETCLYFAYLWEMASEQELENQKTATIVAVFLSVGALGFEPRASYTPCKRASRTAPRPDFRALL